MQNNLHPIFEKILSDFGGSAMQEYCPDEMERAHQAGLPGERLIKCDGCHRQFYEWELVVSPYTGKNYCGECFKEIEAGE